MISLGLIYLKLDFMAHRFEFDKFGLIALYQKLFLRDDSGFSEACS